MNQPQITSTEIIRRTCPKCGYIRETAETICPDCGKTLQKVSTIRALGVVLVVMGASLLVFMSWLSLRIYGTIANPSDSGSHFNGTPKDMLFIIFAFGLVISISPAVTAGGLWQIIFGKRNKLIVFAVLVLGVVFAAIGLAVTVSKYS
jgi:predicted RNA-binding Zn-ribbon protein involved in translation (DUF1610 family)